MNASVGSVRQDPSAARSSTHAGTSLPVTTPALGDDGAEHDAGGDADLVGEQRHDRGVLLVVADDVRGVDELVGRAATRWPGR